jgi:3-methylfumaryl-CoA hydratase
MTILDPARIDEWRSAIGKTERRTEMLEAESLRRFALAIGAEATHAPLAHWAFFLPGPADDEIGQDGHPRRGGFLPDITLPRRMFAGSSIRFEAPFRIGAEAELVSTITDVTHKSGRSGELLFVEVEKTISQDGAPCITERQSYVYREEGAPVPMPIPAAEPPEGEEWTPNEVNLFRFSAATFNGHRIHYDRPYATSEEGYPALVIHGPFTAAKLAGLAMRRGPLETFSFRAMAPLFLGQPVFLHSSATDEVTAFRCDGTPAMTAKVSYK